MNPRSFIVTARTCGTLMRYLDSQLVDGKTLRVTVGENPSKTTSQNAYLHLAIRKLAQHVGSSESEVKDWLKAEYGPPTVIYLNNVMATTKKSRSRYTLEEAAAMIEHVTRIAAECGLLLEPETDW